MDLPVALRRLLVIWAALLGMASATAPADDGLQAPEPELAAAFAAEVTNRLQLPEPEVRMYAGLLEQSLAAAGLRLEGRQSLVLVDRDPQVQALLLYRGAADAGWALVGATPVSTGRPGRYEHFATPPGVYEHSIFNPDFRAEGTKNANGIRGYGRKGSRVYDFGWVTAPKGWGNGAMSLMRLQMHSTDPDVLEPRLGTADSKGCIRIPAALNEFIDRLGLLDADYEEERARGAHFWVLRADRRPVAGPGRYLVVVDSRRTSRPPWSPGPRRR